MGKVKSIQGRRFSDGRIPQSSKIERNTKAKRLFEKERDKHNSTVVKVIPKPEQKNRGYDVSVGEVVLARFKKQTKKDSASLGVRPCIIIHRGGTDNIVEVIPLTKSRPKYEHHIVILDKVLKRPSTILCDNVQTIDKNQIIERWGKIDKENFNIIIKARRKVMDESLKDY